MFWDVGIMSETIYVTDRTFQRLSERVSRLTSEVSDLKRSVNSIEKYLSPGLKEVLPDLDLKEKETVIGKQPYS